MTAPIADLLRANAVAAARRGHATAPASLPTYRVNVMRVGYALMAFGLAATKWPLLPDASSLPVYEGVVAALLTAMSLFAILGLKHPVKLLPLLIFESAWKLVWLGVIALPHLVAGDISPSMDRMLVSVSLVVVILAVTPWDYAWKTYVRAPGDPWRRSPAPETPA